MSGGDGGGLVHSIQARLKNTAEEADRPFAELLELRCGTLPPPAGSLPAKRMEPPVEKRCRVGFQQAEGQGQTANGAKGKVRKLVSRR